MKKPMLQNGLFEPNDSMDIVSSKLKEIQMKVDKSTNLRKR